MEVWEALLVGASAGALTVEMSLTFAYGVFPNAEDKLERGEGRRHIVSHALATLLGGLVSREVALYLVKRSGAEWGSAQSLTLATLAFLAGAAGSYYLFRFLRRRLGHLRIDDPVDAIAIHGVAGLFGTLMVGVLGHAPLLAQTVGVAVAILWSFVLAYIVFSSLNALNSLRVSPKEEADGVGLKGMSFETLPFWTDYEKLSELALKQDQLSSRVSTELVEQMKNLAHQVISPLAGTIGLLHNLVIGARLESNSDKTNVARMKAASGFVQVAAFRVRNMDVLARLEDDQIVKGQEQVSLSDIVSEAVSLFRFLAEHHGGSISFGSQKSAYEVIGDRGLFKHAVMNLVDNAVYYSDPGETVKLRIQDTRSPFVSLHIINKGLPIASEEREKIFERSVRGRMAGTRRPDGTGIGLYIVRRVAHVHDGTLVLVPNRKDERLIEFRLDLPRA